MYVCVCFPLLKVDYCHEYLGWLSQIVQEKSYFSGCNQRILKVSESLMQRQNFQDMFLRKIEL